MKRQRKLRAPGVVFGVFHPIRSPFAVGRRTNICALCIRVFLTIQTLDSANSVISCAVFLASPHSAP